MKQAFLALGGSGDAKWMDLSGSWLDLEGIHPGWSVSAIWPFGPTEIAPGGLQGGQKWPKNAIKQLIYYILL